MISSIGELRVSLGNLPQKDVHQKSFSFDDDLQGVQTLHDDAIVVNIIVANYDIKRILVNNENPLDVLFYDIFFRRRFSFDRLKKINAPLIGFSRDSIAVKGEVTLPITTGSHLDILPFS